MAEQYLLVINAAQADLVRGQVDQFNYCDPIELADGRFALSPAHEDYLISKVGQNYESEILTPDKFKPSDPI